MELGYLCLGLGFFVLNVGFLVKGLVLGIGGHGIAIRTDKISICRATDKS